MIEINRNNYEPFLVDYLEGRTDKETEMAIQLFLIQNRDIEEEFALLKESYDLKTEDLITIPEFNHLKKNYSGNIDSSNIQEYLIAEIEQQLSEKEKKDLENYIHYFPETRKEQEMFAKTILVPDLEIKFQEKKQLKRKEKTPVIYLFQAVSSVAAILIFVLLVNNYFSSTDKNQIAENKDNKFQKTPIENNKKEDVTSAIIFSKAESKKIEIAKSNSEIKNVKKNKTPIVSIQETISEVNADKYALNSTSETQEEISLEKTLLAHEISNSVKNEKVESEPQLKENVQKSTEFKTINQWISSVAKKAAGKYKTKSEKENNETINSSDFAALAAGAINNLTGSNILITEKSSSSNPFAFGIKSERFEIK